MTGPEHYRAGEEQLVYAVGHLEEGTWDEAQLTIALAQAHFVAALAAATAMAATSSLPPSDAWEEKTDGD